MSGRARPRRVLFLGHGAERTGPPILLGHLLDGLRATTDLGATVAVARSGPLSDRYRAAGARVIEVSSGREPLEPLAAALRRTGMAGTVAPLQDRWRRRRLSGETTADLVYVNAATPPTAALLRSLDLAPAIPVVVHVHEMDVGLRMTLDERDRRLLLERADHLIAASGPVAEVLVDGHGVDPARVTTCEEFVDVDAVRPLARADARSELGVPADAAVIGSVGLPDWRKAPDLLLHAIALLAARPEAPSPWVVWIGGSPRSDDGRRLADEVRRLGLAGRFVHVEHDDRPDRWLAALDVFALPAREDALPLAALEAAAAERPLVCFRTGGVAALCDAGAGVAVDYPDVAGLSAAIADLLGDADRRRAAGRRARELVAAHHDLAVGTQRIVDVIDRVLAATP